MEELNKTILIVIWALYVCVAGGIFFSICGFMADEEKMNLRKNGIREPWFDERQLADRAAAYRAGFLTMLVYDGLYILLKEGVGFVWCEDVFGFGLGAVAGLTVFTVSCVRREALWKNGILNTSTSGLLRAVLLLCFTALCGMCRGIIRDGSYLRDGLVSSSALAFFCALYVLFLYSMLDAEIRTAEKRKKRKPT